MHLQAIKITDHLRKRICERINHLSLSYHAKKHALMWRLVSLKISKNLQYHRRRCFHKISSKSAILMLFIWHKFKTEGKNSGSSIIHPRWFLFRKNSWYILPIYLALESFVLRIHLSGLLEYFPSTWEGSKHTLRILLVNHYLSRYPFVVSKMKDLPLLKIQIQFGKACIFRLNLHELVAQFFAI